MKKYKSPKIQFNIYLLEENLAVDILSIFLEGETQGGENDSWDEEEEW